MDSKDVSGEIFALNLYSNHDDFDENLAVLAELGISVNWHKCTQITPDMLHEIFMDVKNGLWEHFCNQIYFADEKIGAQMHESLLNLPSNPAYHHFFDEKEYRKINVYENHIYERAVKNAKRSRAI